jgi:hypothetical protein
MDLHVPHPRTILSTFHGASDLGTTNQSSKESIHFFRIVQRILAVKAGEDGFHAITFDII